MRLAGHEQWSGTALSQSASHWYNCRCIITPRNIWSCIYGFISLLWIQATQFCFFTTGIRYISVGYLTSVGWMGDNGSCLTSISQIRPMGFPLIFVQKNPNDGISVNFCEVYRARRKLLNFRVRAWTPTEVPYILPPQKLRKLANFRRLTSVG
jgi:hypothetical protein